MSNKIMDKITGDTTTCMTTVAVLGTVASSIYLSNRISKIETLIFDDYEKSMPDLKSLKSKLLTELSDLKRDVNQELNRITSTIKDIQLDMANIKHVHALQFQQNLYGNQPSLHQMTGNYQHHNQYGQQHTPQQHYNYQQPVQNTNQYIPNMGHQFTTNPVHTNTHTQYQQSKPQKIDTAHDINELANSILQETEFGSM
jgi:hypothetical protein